MNALPRAPRFRGGRLRNARGVAVGTMALALFLATVAPGVPQEGAQSGPPPAPVRVSEATREDLAPRRKVFGELRASRRATVAAEESGIVRELLVREGESVAAGAPIARLDPVRLELEAAMNAANLAAARATVAERAAHVGREERTLSLLRRAASDGGTNPRELADAESDLAIAGAQLAQANAAVAVIEQQGALLAKRRADLEVRAPFAGVVLARQAELGAWVAAGGAVVDLADTAMLEAWFDVPQELLESAQRLVRQAEGSQPTPGSIGGVEIRTTTGATVAPRAVRIVPEIDERSRTFHAILSVPNPEGALAAGLALHAYVPEGAPAPWIVVPKDALVYSGLNATVYCVESGLARPVAVRVAFPVGDRVALEGEPFPAGSIVVVEGNERLMPMAPVAPIAARSTEVNK